MSTQVIDGVTVEADGSGDAVVLVHGLGGTANTWTPLMSLLAGRYRVIRPDLPGSGRSPRNGSVSIEGFADAVLSVMATLGAERAHLVGHSMGTIVCQHIAERKPAAVRSLALFGPIHAPPDAARQGLKERAAAARKDGMADIADAVVARTTAAATRSERLAAVAFVRESLMRQEPEGYAATCEALSAARPAELAKIGCPVLLRTGDEDATAPPAAQQAMADALRDVDAAVFERCGHWTTIERPEASSRALGDFLARVH